MRPLPNDSNERRATQPLLSLAAKPQITATGLSFSFMTAWPLSLFQHLVLTTGPFAAGARRFTTRASRWAVSLHAAASCSRYRESWEKPTIDAGRHCSEHEVFPRRAPNRGGVSIFRFVSFEAKPPHTRE